MASANQQETAKNDLATVLHFDFSANYDENSYGEFTESDGISEHIQGGISLVVSVSPIGSGKSIVSPEIVRNADVEPTE